jgi:uncharacterized membrane protein YfcA
MPIDLLSQYAFLLAVIVCAYFIRGVTGFGSALIAVPLLALYYPLKTIVPLILVMDFIASFVLGGTSTKNVDWSEIKRLVPFSLLGAVFGVFALMRFPSISIMVGMGIFVMFFGFRNLFGVQPTGNISPLWAVPAGLVGSTAGALFGTGGPPYIIYLTHRLQDKAAVRSTFSWLFVIDGGARLVMFLVTGLLTDPKTMAAIAVAFVPMALGLYLGNKVHVSISKEAMFRMVGGLLLASGGTLVAKGIL